MVWPTSWEMTGGLGPVFMEKPQSHKTVEPSVLGLVDHTHPAVPELLDDAVVRDGLADELGGVAIGGSVRSYRWERSIAILSTEKGYCNFAYSALASFRMGMSGSASFQRVTKSWYAVWAFAGSPCIAYARARPT